eukprot:9469415-Pyramimonas_sp.AAC.1
MGYVCLHIAPSVEKRLDAVLQAALREEPPSFQLVACRVDAVNLRDLAMVSHACSVIFPKLLHRRLGVFNNFCGMTPCPFCTPDDPTPDL